MFTFYIVFIITQLLYCLDANTHSLNGKFVHFKFRQRWKFVKSGAIFTKFKADLYILVDMGSTYFVTAVSIKYAYEAKITYLVINATLKGDSPHNLINRECEPETSLAKFSNFTCDNFTRFIDFKMTAGEMSVEDISVEGHGTFAEMYVGCFKSDLVGGQKANNLKDCLDKCFRGGKILAGMSNSFCHCLSNTVAMAQVEASKTENCNNYCLDGQLCGKNSLIPVHFTDYNKHLLKNAITSECVTGKCKKCALGSKGLTCFERDCRKIRGGCGQRGTCEDNKAIINTVHCRCNDGFYVSEFHGQCNDIDECSNKADKCDRDTTNCVNSFGSYTCQCKSGFKTANVHACKDIDECDTGACDKDTTTCINTIGSFSCRCNPGLIVQTPFKCQDKDECQTETDECDRKTTKCVNTHGNYTCECGVGHARLTEFECYDIDECLSNPCHELSTNCTNLIGSFFCRCHPGHKRITQFQCQDIDECLHSKTNKCQQNTTVCKNVIGSYECICAPGLAKSNKFDCTDFNECETSNTNLCNLKTTDCFNVWGSYKCKCRPGFNRVDRYHCEDIDECEISTTNGCDRSVGTCHNTFGSYTCTCDDGYDIELFGYVTVCQDIDECKDIFKHACDLNISLCINIKGSYSCACQGMYQNTDQYTCEYDYDNSTTDDMDYETTTDIRESFATDFIQYRITVYIAVLIAAVVLVLVLYSYFFILHRVREDKDVEETDTVREAESNADMEAL